MRPLSKNEVLSIIIILFVIFGITYKNLLLSLRRARDMQRNNDLVSVTDALSSYFDEYGFYPPSENGEIQACKGTNFDEVMNQIKNAEEFDREMFFAGLKGCKWGVDPLPDVLTEEDNYLEILPQDPKKDLGISYTYLSDTVHFQVYGYLEGEADEVRYNPGVVARGIRCGVKTCNFGRAPGETPLDKSIEEYEQSLRESLKSGN